MSLILAERSDPDEADADLAVERVSRTRDGQLRTSVSAENVASLKREPA